MSNKDKILWITRTALFIAVLITFQALSASLGQYVTGSLVNLVLILAVMLGGLWSGIAVATVSPVFAFLLSVGPAFPPFIPFIILGNLTIVLVWHFIAGKNIMKNLNLSRVIAAVAGAVLKFLVLYLGIVRFAIPVLLSLPEAQASILSLNFSFPQIITASIGGAVAVAILPLLSRIMAKPAV